MSMTRSERVIGLVREAGVLRPRDLAVHGIARDELVRLYHKGALQRSARGLYMLADATVTEQHTLAEACKRVPAGVICLLSALRFHDLTTQEPFEVWLALDPKARRPQVDELPLRIVRFSGQALTEGIEEHSIEGVTARVYNPAKTVADCFKYRHKIGLDVALEALREAWQRQRCTMDDLWRYAKVCRVSNVMRPYMEALGTLR